MRSPGHETLQVIRAQEAPPVTAGVQVLLERILDRHGVAVQAVLFYGACLRGGEVRGQIVDLYVLVDDYAHAHQGRLQALLNRALPPSVYYLEAQAPDYPVRAKYAVISLSDFRRGTLHWFNSYLWGRFAQPIGILHARSDTVREQIHQSLAQAVYTLARRTIPCLPDTFSARQLWETALGLSYATELRPERPARAHELFESTAAYYERLAQALAADRPELMELKNARFRAHVSPRGRNRGRRAWRLRRWQGKPLSLLRLAKSLLTFQGGVDYIAWKVERHSGIAIKVTPRLRRHPLLAGWAVLWRLYRSGSVR